MNRRNFLRGCLAVTALAILPVPDLHAYPILYGDGIHDDTEALQALLDLKPYVCEGELIKGQERAVINGGIFKVRNTIFIRNDKTEITRSSFLFTDKNIDAMMEVSHGVEGCMFLYSNFESLHPSNVGIRMLGAPGEQLYSWPIKQGKE